MIMGKISVFNHKTEGKAADGFWVIVQLQKKSIPTPRKVIGNS